MSLCRELPWDSGFFAKKIARADAHRVDKNSLTEITDWCREREIDCLYFLADADDSETIRLLEGAGFHFVDIRTTLETKVTALRLFNPRIFLGPVDFRIRAGRLEDLPALRAIAGVSHVDSRFYNDGRFPPERCRNLYEVWIEKSVNGWAQAVLVAELNGEAVGYITCHFTSTKAEIGLLGVGEKAQGRGLGQQLIAESLRWFQEQGVKEVTVVTQGRNIRAQRVYQKAGFLVRSIQLWYHFWRGPAAVLQ
jgi:dTDP-4-amino-4,6-dideoxy-D-galactose acyltransferase